jgi:excisionase family DNA binding protein
MKTEQLLYTEAQAAKLLSLSTKTVSRLRKAGKLHCLRIGTAIRYDLQSLHSWIQSTKSIVIG